MPAALKNPGANVTRLPSYNARLAWNKRWSSWRSSMVLITVAIELNAMELCVLRMRSPRSMRRYEFVSTKIYDAMANCTPSTLAPTSAGSADLGAMSGNGDIWWCNQGYIPNLCRFLSLMLPVPSKISAWLISLSLIYSPTLLFFLPTFQFGIGVGEASGKFSTYSGYIRRPF